ncbi:MAG: hypothetical protein ACE5FF_06390, partial [Saprospiraceae bacterium]
SRPGIPAHVAAIKKRDAPVRGHKHVIPFIDEGLRIGAKHFGPPELPASSVEIHHHMTTLWPRFIGLETEEVLPEMEPVPMPGLNVVSFRQTAQPQTPQGQGNRLVQPITLWQKGENQNRHDENNRDY